MKKLVQLAALASLSLFVASCNSDDNSIVDPPIIEKTYHLSKIEQNIYEEDDTTDEENPEQYVLHVIYKFDYDANYKLNKIFYEDTGYNGNKEVVRKQAFEMLHTLDEQGRLKIFEIKDGANTLNSYAYTYENDLLQATTYNLINQGGAFTSTFTYNEKKQLITNKALSINLLIDYSYNAQNQMNQIKMNGQGMKITYDDKLSPFYNLPYDLTSLLIQFNYVFPYTYKFPNNITSFRAGDEGADIEFTYNEADLPIKAIYYEGKKEEGGIAFEVTYTYEIKETIIKP